MYRRVLVPLDGSPVAEAILPFVLDIAGPLDIEVVLVRVLVPIPPSVMESSRHVVVDDVEGRRVAATEYLAPLVRRLAMTGVRATSQVRRGEPAAEILAAAKEARADLIAMTTHGRTGPARLLFGFVAESVLRRAEIPVLLMRQTEAEMARRLAATGSGAPA